MLVQTMFTHFILPLLLSQSFCYYSNAIATIVPANSTTRTDEAYLCQNDSLTAVCQDETKPTPHNKVTTAAAEENSKQCSLYLATSSIPNSGFGVYTTRDIKIGTSINKSSADGPSIVVVDPDIQGGDDLIMAHENYFLDGEGYSGFEADDVSESSVTLGSLANYHPYLRNIDNVRGEYDDSLSNRFTDPSAGAFSYYKGQTFVAERDIMAGEELFADYGEDWLDNRQGSESDSIPRHADFEKAGSIMMNFERAQADNENNGDEEGNIMKILKNATSILNKRIGSILPSSKSELRQILPQKLASEEEGTVEMLERRLAYHTTNVRDVHWIETNGMCLDNLIPKTSTLPLAGQGAFAQRFISKGGLIVPVPLLAITDRKGLNMYKLKRNQETGSMERSSDEVIGSQLILNYCFGHAESTFLLCPSTNAILINHCSNRKPAVGHCWGKGPNAEIRWASWDESNDTWLKASLDEVKEWTVEGHRGLSFEVIALRDIEPGEEVFIDYGRDWEMAFAAHVKNWVPPQEDSGFDKYASVKAMNDEHLDFRTILEQKIDPYPENIAMVCFKITDYLDYDVDAEGEEDYYGGYTNEDIIYEIDDEDPDLILTSGENHDFSTGGLGWHWPCQVLKNEGDGRYNVRILAPPSPKEDQQGWARRNLARILTNYPGTLIKFVHKSYASDQFLPRAFRHNIGIHDNMFPSRWKNLAVGRENNR